MANNINSFFDLYSKSYYDYLDNILNTTSKNELRLKKINKILNKPEYLIEPLKYIELIKKTFGRYDSNGSGNCLKFAIIMKIAYPNGIICYNSNHVIIKIDNKYYDIDGVVENVDNYLRWDKYGIDYFLSSFSNLLTEEEIKIITK